MADEVLKLDNDFEDSIRMRFIYTMLKSQIKTQQVKALQDINDLISDGKDLYGWLVSWKVLENVMSFNDCDLIINLDKILLVLSQDYLSKYHIDYMYQGLSNSSLTKACKFLLCNISNFLSLDLISYIFTKFTQETLIHVRFAKDFTLKVLYQFDYSIENYPLNYFKSLLSDKYYSYHSIAIEALVSIYSRFSLHSIVESEITNMITEISHDIRVVQNIRLVLSIFKNHVRLSNTSVFDNPEQVIKKVGKFNENEVYTAKESITSRLEFIEFLIITYKKIEFKHIKKLWKSFVFTENEDVFFSWIGNCIKYFPLNLIEEIYRKYFSDNIRYDKLTEASYECFHKIFLVINKYEQLIELKFDHFEARTNRKIQSLANLVDIALYSDNEIYQKSIKLLVSLNTRFSDTVYYDRKVIWDDFFRFLIDKSSILTNQRLLSLLLAFLEPFSSNNVTPVFFVFKTSREKYYSGLYIEENSTIRDLKIKISNHYKKPPETIILRSEKIEYTKHHDDFSVKYIQHSMIKVNFDENKPLGFKEYLEKSKIIQEWLLDSLCQSNEYSVTAYKILSILQGSCDTKAFKMVSDKIIQKNYLTLSYYSKIIQKLLNDSVSVGKFLQTDKIDLIIRNYCDCASEDIDFNINIINLIKFSLSAGYNAISCPLIQRLFNSLASLALNAPDEMLLDSVQKVYEIIKMVIAQDKDIVEHSIQKYGLYDNFISNTLIICKYREFTEIIVSILIELCASIPEIFRMTLSSLLKNLDLLNSIEISYDSYFILLEQLLTTEPSPFYFDKISNTLIEVSSCGQKIPAKGLISCIKLFADTNAIGIQEILLNKVIFCCYSVSCSKLVRKKSFKILFDISMRNKSLSCEVISHISKLFEVSDWKTSRIQDWNYSPNSVNHDHNSITLLSPSESRIISQLNNILYVMYSVKSFRDQVLNLKHTDSKFLVRLRKIFKNLHLNYKQYINTSKLWALIEAYSVPLGLDFSNIEKFFDSFIKLLSDELYKFDKNKEFIFKGTFIKEFIGKNNCFHVEQTEIHFNYFRVPVRERNVEKYCGKLLECKDNNELNNFVCKLCNLEVLASVKTVIKQLPGVLAVVIQRFNSLSGKKVVKSNEYCEFPLEITVKSSDDDENTISNYNKYNLIGFIAHKGTAKKGIYSTYIKYPEYWMEFTDKSIKKYTNSNIYQDLYGVKSVNASKTDKTAVILFYESFKHENTVRSSRYGFYINELSNINQVYCIKILFTHECSRFVHDLLKNNTLETLEFGLKYFLFILIRTNNTKNIFKMFKTLFYQLEVHPKVSEWLLELIKEDKVQQELLLTCPDRTKSQIIIELIHKALICSRPSAYIRLLKVLLEKLIHKPNNLSDSFCEIIYIICKSYPELAAEQESVKIILKYINLYTRPLVFRVKDVNIDIKISGYLICAIYALIMYLKTEEKKTILSKDFMNKVQMANHTKFTAYETGKLYAEITTSDIGRYQVYYNIVFDFICVSNEKTIKFYLTQLKYMLETTENEDIINKILTRILKIIEEKDLPLGFIHYCIDFVCTLIYENNKVKYSAYKISNLIDCFEKHLRPINDQINSNGFFFNCTISEKIDLIKKLKNKSYFEKKTPEKNGRVEIYEKKNHQKIETDVLMKMNETCVVKVNNKYKIYDFRTEEVI